MKILEEFIQELKAFGIKKASIISGVSSGTIYNWTRRRRTPALDAAQKVANAMGLEILLVEKGGTKSD